MSELTVKDRVTEMARNSLGPAMKAAGFRRTGRVFWRNKEDVCHIVVLAMNRMGSKDESSFHVQLGVFWHHVEKILQNPSVGKVPPPEYQCTFRIDLASTVPGEPRPRWDVTGTTDYSALAREVLDDLQRYGLPWLDYRSDLNRSLEWKRYRRPIGGDLYTTREMILPDAQVVFKVMLGKKREAKADLKRFAANGWAKTARLGRRLKILD